MRRPSGPRPTRSQRIKFEHRLVLANWMLEVFGVSRFEDLARTMREPGLEGFDEDNISRFHHSLRRLIERPELPRDLLLAYDENIVRHWKAITARRNADGHPLYPKYFQYLCLLFTEIYLDRYFRDPERLLADLNSYLARFNAGDTPQQQALGGLFAAGLPDDARLPAFTLEDLKKVAFWSATGSGKTLLMHINILQYRHYLGLHGKDRQLNRIILLTPNEGLSRQHLDEFHLSGMDAGLFDKDAPSLFAGESIEIIDVHKLRASAGEKTVAVGGFENRNLVLVDEGHRGTSGADVGLWMKMRNQLCEQGFSFEYSATFGQAMKASGNRDLEKEYAKCILFDYSYKYFYGDGYGKEYRILNLEDDSHEQDRRRYLIASLLAFHQQQRVFQDRNADAMRFLIEKPLWIFVGGSVTRTKPTQKDVSDVVDILLFLAGFVKDRAAVAPYLAALVAGRSGLHDQQGHELFSDAYTYLGQLGLSGEQLFDDILRTVFHASTPGALHVRQLKGGEETEGEVALHVGEENPPFGVINVGDPSGLCQLCGRPEHHDDLLVSDSEFAESIFRRVNRADSSINVLIGSRKFSEGWSSWRVSTMGLMNIGRKEGAQIIQLFGRGVRLKGLDFSLKRSQRLIHVRPPQYIDRLETLNVFGVRADYMRQFKEYLEDEGLPTERRLEFILPVVNNLGQKKLKTVRLKDGVDFKRQGPKPSLGSDGAALPQNRVVVDWYPKIRALASVRGQGSAQVGAPDETWFSEEHLAFMDMDAVYWDLQHFKNERAWWNLNLPKEEVKRLLADPSWYVLQIPREEMEFRSFDQVRQWQEIATVLLRRYCDRFYRGLKAAWENDHLEYRELSADDGNFIENYEFLLEESRQDIVTKLEEIKALIESGQLHDVDFQGLMSIAFDRHLYEPLLHLKNDQITVKPVALNDGERDFVLHLRDYCASHQEFFEGKELYLLRNMTRGRGIGFFEEGYFYPDFILWLLADGRQYINFIDPKGLRNLQGPDDPKIAFHQKIKEIEERLRAQDPAVTLNSFIISNTPLAQLAWWHRGMSKEDFESHHVLFQQEDRETYIEKLLAAALE